MTDTVVVYFDTPFNGLHNSPAKESVSDVANVEVEDGFLWLFNEHDEVLAIFQRWNYWLWQ